jgi:hypothetical protein
VHRARWKRLQDCVDVIVRLFWFPELWCHLAKLAGATRQEFLTTS